MTEQFTLEKNLQVSLERIEQNRLIVRAYETGGRSVSPEELVSYLFFDNEQLFFGLLVETNEHHVILSADQLLEAFPESHPYVHFTQSAYEGNISLEAAREAANEWRKKTLWETAIADEAGIHFQSEQLNVSSQAADLLQAAVYSKLTNSMISPSQIGILLPHLQKYGWPGEFHEDLPIRVALRLTEPDDDAETTNWLLETVIINERGRHWVPAIRKKSLPISETLPKRWERYGDEIFKRQSEMLSFLQSLQIETKTQFLSHTMNDSDVRIFLQEDLPLLQSFGYPVVLPSWLKSITETKMQVSTNASVQSYQSATGLDEVLAFDWNFSLAGKEIDQQTFQRLVDENREFIRAGDEWFHIDPEWLQKIRELMERADAGEWTVKDLLFQEIPEEIVPLKYEDEEDTDDPLLIFSMQQSLRTYMETLAEKKGLPTAGIPSSLQASLRPYQEDGYNWLIFMRDNGFGTCLADDMGLGKTIQLITYLLNVHERPDTDHPSLIICPTSVLGNWQKELERFAPSLSVHLHYGPSREKDEAFEALITEEKPDVILTTYGTASQDGDMLAETEFTSITLDEAQNIKNMQTKQSRAIRKLNGQHHIALTGTPIENRLSELWAIFDFIHRGYFGNFRTFTDQYIIPIERDDSERDKKKLRNKIRPFLLRRTKNDEDLLLNLPKKIEQNEYCPLTTEQAALYESFIDETKFKLQSLSGFEKKGLVLTMLNRLKQLCNHPSLFLKEPNLPASEMINRSEKLKSIVSMAGNIASNGEQCIIFTQYIGMGRLLQQCLSELHQIDAPFLTGSMPKAQRDRLVEEFQQGEFPIFILSLRAGGTGLNLTAANHVLHADRWWNPAVENQATDRAYRIGQTKFVHVHKFVTIGTIEEKIDKMLEEKAALSADLILSNQWLAELSDDELDDLLSFG